MTEILFYRPTKTTSQKILPKLLESVISKGNNVHIICENEEQMNNYDDFLWTYEQLSFLPHATINDEMLDKQPIILSTETNVFNNAKVAVSLSNKVPKDVSKFERVIYIFDTTQSAEFEKIKSECANSNFSISCFIQNDKGWEKAGI